MLNEVSVYRNSNPINQDFSPERNFFLNDDSNPHANELYDVPGDFNTTTCVWSPSVAGKYNICVTGSFGTVGDANFILVSLYNVTQVRTENEGGQGRNEGSGQYTSVLTCQVDVNGTDTFELRARSNESTVSVKGIVRHFTYFQAFRFA